MQFYITDCDRIAKLLYLVLSTGQWANDVISSRGVSLGTSSLTANRTTEHRLTRNPVWEISWLKLVRPLYVGKLYYITEVIEIVAPSLCWETELHNRELHCFEVLTALTRAPLPCLTRNLLLFMLSGHRWLRTLYLGRLWFLTLHLCIYVASYRVQCRSTVIQLAATLMANCTHFYKNNGRA